MFRALSTVALVAVGSFAIANAEESKEAGGNAKSLPMRLAVDIGKEVKLEMVLIREGRFMMGSPDADHEAPADEKPQHRVRITRPFYLGKYLVTQEQWEAIMGSNPSDYKGVKNPVEAVSWDDCQKFLDKLNAKCGTREGNFRSPSEAQWGSLAKLEARQGIASETRRANWASMLGTKRTRAERPTRWARRSRTIGVYMICMATCGSGAGTGTTRTTIRIRRWTIRQGPQWARNV